MYSSSSSIVANAPGLTTARLPSASKMTVVGHDRPAPIAADCVPSESKMLGNFSPTSAL